MWGEVGRIGAQVGPGRSGRPGRPEDEVSGSLVGAAGDAGATVRTFLPMLFEAKVALGVMLRCSAGLSWLPRLGTKAR